MLRGHPKLVRDKLSFLSPRRAATVIVTSILVPPRRKPSYAGYK